MKHSVLSYYHHLIISFDLCFWRNLYYAVHMVIEWFSYSGVIIMANHNGLQECSKQIWREELRAHPLLITNCVWDKHFVCAAQCGSIIQSFALIISMWPYQTIWNWNKGKRKLSHMILFLLSCILLSSNILRCFFSPVAGFSFGGDPSIRLVRLILSYTILMRLTDENSLQDSSS